jgi:hypothetical protein
MPIVQMRVFPQKSDKGHTDFDRYLGLDTATSAQLSADQWTELLEWMRGKLQYGILMMIRNEPL